MRAVEPLIVQLKKGKVKMVLRSGVYRFLSNSASTTPTIAIAAIIPIDIGMKY